MALISICHWTFIRFYSFFLLFVLFLPPVHHFIRLCSFVFRWRWSAILNHMGLNRRNLLTKYRSRQRAVRQVISDISFYLYLYLWSVRGYLVRQRGTVDFVTFIEWIIMIDSRALNCKECSVIAKVGCIIVLVTQLPGKNINPGMQILAQGNQVALVANFLLGKLSIMLSWLTTRLSLYHTAAGRFSQFRIMQWL